MGREALGQAGQAQVAAVVGWNHHAAEQLVVAPGQAGGAVRVLPHPGREPAGQGVLLVAGGDGLGVVAHPPAVLGLVGDGVEALVQAGVEQGDGIGSRRSPLRAEADRGPPSRPQGDAPAPEGRYPLHLDLRPEHLAAEGLDVGGRDPGRAEAGGDLARLQLAGQHGLQGGDVGLPAGIEAGRGLGLVELGPDIARQVPAGRHQLSRSRVLPRGVAQLRPGRLDIGAQQLGDTHQVEGAGLVQADGDRLGGVVDPQPLHRRGDDAPVEDGRPPGHLGLVVEDLQRRDEGPVGIVAEAAHAGPDAPHHVLAGVGVHPPGAGRAEAVERPVHPAVGAVGVGQLALEAGQLGIAGAGHLGGQHRSRRVTQADQAPQLGNVGAVAGSVGPELPALRPGQPPAGDDDEAALLDEGRQDLGGRQRSGQRRGARRQDVAQPAGVGIGDHPVQCAGQRRP